jgi:hypothetical protein
MHDAPNLPTAQISATLKGLYGLRIQSLTFLPIGNDSATFVYEAIADDGTRYFVKLRSASGFGALSLLVPRALHEQGVANIVVPLQAAGGALCAPPALLGRAVSYTCRVVHSNDNPAPQ